MTSEKQNIFWASNLKFLRDRRKFTQQDLANQVGISREKLNSHENGKSKNPPLEDLLVISGFFRFSIDALIKVDLSRVGELKLRELEAGSDIYLSGGKIKVLAITVDRQNNENMEVVPIKAKAGYRNGYNDPQFIAELPKFSLPHLSPKKTYRMFPTEGKSMYPIPEKSYIITTYIADWLNIKDETLCIVILKNDQDFLFKSVINTLEEDNMLILRSLNTEFSDQQVHVSEVLEIWKYHSYVSDKIPELSGSGDMLMKELREIKSTLNIIRDRK